MTCAVSTDICMIANNDFFFDLQLFESDGTTVIDLTGATAIMQLLTITDAPSSTKDMNGGITNAANGQMRFTLTDVETQALLTVGSGNSTTFVSDVQITFVDTTKEVVLRVNVLVEQGRNR